MELPFPEERWGDDGATECAPQETDSHLFFELRHSSLFRPSFWLCTIWEALKGAISLCWMCFFPVFFFEKKKKLLHIANHKIFVGLSILRLYIHAECVVGVLLDQGIQIIQWTLGMLLLFCFFSFRWDKNRQIYFFFALGFWNIQYVLIKFFIMFLYLYYISDVYVCMQHFG